MLNSAKNILWIDISEYTSRNTNTNTIIVTFMHKRAVKYGSSQPLFVCLALEKRSRVCASYFLECIALLRFHSLSVPSSEADSSTAWLG